MSVQPRVGSEFQYSANTIAWLKDVRKSAAHNRKHMPDTVEELETHLLPTLLGNNQTSGDNPWNQTVADAPVAKNSDADETTTAFSDDGQAANVAVVSDSRTTATALADAAGTAEVSATTADGSPSAAAASRYNYRVDSSRPRVVHVSRRSGPANGGTTVTILGNHFTTVTEVLFGRVAATSFKVVSGNRIVAVAPPNAVEVVDILVSTTVGTSAAGQAGQFAYVAAPEVTQVKPDHGPTRGGTLVVVHGGNFVAGQTKVYFGKRPGKDVKVLSARLLVVKSPANEAGTVPLTVTTLDGESNEEAFEYT